MTPSKFNNNLIKVSDYLHILDTAYLHGMRVPGHLYISEKLLDVAIKDNALSQVANVATLPGIVKASIAMPDIHWGYGFVIGGVAAFDPDNGGIVSPGGVGYDINCGVRLIRTNLTSQEISGELEKIVNQIFRDVPVGVGEGGRISYEKDEMKKILKYGAKKLVDDGLSWDSDLHRLEENGCMDGADPTIISDRAFERGKRQCGSLGAGNHFLEIQRVDEIFDNEAAQVYGLHKDGICVMIHTGSRGLGHQTCEDTLKIMRDAVTRYKIDLPDRQLACAPINSAEGEMYLAAMACSANFAWANRSIITHHIRYAFERILGTPSEKLGMNIVYDVSHNIAKWETHDVDDRQKRLLVHRKGATRAFPKGHREIPLEYRHIGQPVLIPGDMGSSSWVLRAQSKSMEATFGSACHGAGRAMGRNEAKKKIDYNELTQRMKNMGIMVRAGSKKGLVEEAPEAYKDVDDVIDVTHLSGIATRVARLIPLAVIKG